jgi:hypothetical protein
LETAQNTFDANFTGCNQNVTNQTNLNSGQWTHVIGVKEATNWKIFVNGVLNNTSSGTLNYNLNSGFNLIIGVQNDNLNPTTYWDGLIDDIGIWNRALTQQEITNLYNSSAYVPCASPAFPANLASGLVGYWPFCGDANDESGNGNNGTVNGATLTSDRFGNPNSAYDFDGVDDWISTACLGPTANSERTISFWANSVLKNTCGSVAWSYGNAQANQAFISSVTCFDNAYAAGISDAASVSVDTNICNQWHHYVVTVPTGATKQQDIQLYKDGFLITNLQFYNPTYIINTGNSFPFNIGRLFYSDNCGFNYFKGFLDDIGIWNRALNASEIQQLYNTGIYFQTVTGSCDTLQFNANITGFSPVTYQNQVKVFPNPAKDNLVIDCGANFNTLTGYSIKILNTVGQSVYNSLITQQVTNIPLTAPTWSPGAYVVQFINPTGTVIEAKQIIIQ